MDTDTCDWTARHIVHLQLHLVMYSKTHTQNTKRCITEQNIVKNIRYNQRNRHLKYYKIEFLWCIGYIKMISTPNCCLSVCLSIYQRVFLVDILVSPVTPTDRSYPPSVCHSDFRRK